MAEVGKGEETRRPQRLSLPRRSTSSSRARRRLRGELEGGRA